jgi:uncharacterized membrane protein
VLQASFDVVSLQVDFRGDFVGHTSIPAPPTTRLELLWPALAATAATLLGIASCVLVAWLIPGRSSLQIVAPLVGLTVVWIAFGPMARHVAPPRKKSDRVTSFVLAMVASWFITAWATWYGWARMARAPDGKLDLVDDALGQLAGLLIGGVVAAVIAARVAAYFVSFEREAVTGPVTEH